MKFDEIAKELGYIKPYDEVPLWYKEQDGGQYKVSFSVNKEYEMTEKYEHLLTQQYVRDIMSKAFVTTIAKEENLKWIVPMLACDFYYHEWASHRVEKELKYATIAIQNNPNLKPEQFSGDIREELAKIIQNEKTT